MAKKNNAVAPENGANRKVASATNVATADNQNAVSVMNQKSNVCQMAKIEDIRKRSIVETSEFMMSFEFGRFEGADENFCGFRPVSITIFRYVRGKNGRKYRTYNRFFFMQLVNRNGGYSLWDIKVSDPVDVNCLIVDNIVYYNNKTTYQYNSKDFEKYSELQMLEHTYLHYLNGYKCLRKTKSEMKTIRKKAEEGSLLH